jgi:hypothetical protein
MFSFFLNSSRLQQHDTDDVRSAHPPKRTRPLLQAVRLRRNTQRGQHQEEQNAQERSPERRQLADRRKAVRPMLPDRQNVGDRRKKDRRRFRSGI